MTAAWRCPPCTGEGGGGCRCADASHAHQDEGIVVVAYTVGTYAGKVTVTGCLADEDDDTVLARARRIVIQRAGGSLPFGSQSWRVVSRG